MQANLALICGTAFTAVFLLLTLLAGVIEAITRLASAPATASATPARSKRQVSTSPASPQVPSPSAPASGAADAARVAAITATYRRLFPDKSVVRIEEITQPPTS